MDIDRFMVITAVSGWVDIDAVKDAFDEFKAGSRSPDSRSSDLAAFCDYLESRSLLKRWQCRVLTEDRTIGYHGKYRLLAKRGSIAPTKSYLS
jgi:hypothetical protein